MIKTKLQYVKRALILEEAAKLFERVGYEQLKVSDLAKSVGVSVGSIYGMFESKEGLYMAYVKSQITHYIETLEARCAETASPEAQLEEAYRLKFENFAAKRKAVEDYARNNPLFFSNIRYAEPEILEKVYVKIAEIIRGIAPEKNETEALRLAYTLSGLSDGYLMHWLTHGGDLLAQAPQLHAQMLTIIKGC